MEHKYYFLGESIPVRVTFNDNGQKMGAEVPNRKIGGLTPDATYLSRVSNSHEVEEISKEAFEIKCQEYLHK